MTCSESLVVRRRPCRSTTLLQSAHRLAYRTRWTNFADRRDIVAVEAKLADDYEASDQGVKVVDVPVINAYKSPPDRVPPNKPNFHKSYGYLRTPELSNVVRGFV